MLAENNFNLMQRLRLSWNVFFFFRISKVCKHFLKIFLQIFFIEISLHRKCNSLLQFILYCTHAKTKKYFTLNRKGLISEVNFTLCKLMQ